MADNCMDAITGTVSGGERMTAARLIAMFILFTMWAVILGRLK